VESPATAAAATADNDRGLLIAVIADDNATGNWDESAESVEWTETVAEFAAGSGNDCTITVNHAAGVTSGNVINANLETMAASDPWWVLTCIVKEAAGAGGTSETPTPGGGTAGGASPSASVASSVGGGVAAGPAPVARVTTTIAGGVAAGVAPTSSATVSAGGASAAGTTTTATVTVTAGGGIAGGTSPTDGSAVEETPTRGGATAGGTSPGGAIVTSTAGGGGAGGVGCTATASFQPGGATAGGQINDPLQVFITAFFDSPTPSSAGFGAGGPTAGRYDAPTPERIRT
jgi:hypothetical protein